MRQRAAPWRPIGPEHAAETVLADLIELYDFVGEQNVARPFRLSLTIRLRTPLSSGAAGVGAVMADQGHSVFDGAIDRMDQQGHKAFWV